jgi:hypothetical protein
MLIFHDYLQLEAFVNFLRTKVSTFVYICTLLVTVLITVLYMQTISFFVNIYLLVPNRSNCSLFAKVSSFVYSLLFVLYSSNRVFSAVSQCGQGGGGLLQPCSKLMSDQRTRTLNRNR